MTKPGHLACGAAGRMSGHGKSMNLQLCTQTAATLLSLLLMMAVVDPSQTVAASRTQECGNPLLQTLRLSRLVQKDSVDVIKTYKASQGDMSELICKVSLSGLPDPAVGGLEASEQLGLVHARLQEFRPHFRRVLEQQTDLQLPDGLLLEQLRSTTTRSLQLDAQISSLHQSLFPNSAPLLPDPTGGGATALPPPQNVFQQKVYGCVVLKTYKELLANVSRLLRTLRTRVCGVSARRGNLFF